ALWKNNPVRLVSKDRRRVFTEVYRSPLIKFTAVAGEQYWLFTDAPPEQEDTKNGDNKETDECI
ncbi:MAG: hypothetical protein IKP09_10215, partial [Lentisphaeria bacterium]|nr:hypothetical protein [Lentisphaeria bacterium]